MSKQHIPSATVLLPLREAARVAGLSADMVDYLCKRKIVVPTGQQARGRGVPRLYKFGDLVLLRAVSHILRAGTSVARLGTALHNFEERYGPISLSQLPGKYFFTDGQKILFYDKSTGSVEDLLNKNQLCFGYFVNLEEARSQIVSMINTDNAPTSMEHESLKSRVTEVSLVKLAS